ncbi:hypothetical protein [Streptomyces sp. NPDC057052]|uniref:hypothetical protein n=1 Tax=Streptomyces sp. NPDC057052 TaxID=3346010 RepID=UPI003637367A
MFVADQQAHRTVHRRFATGGEPRRMVCVSSPLLSCAVGPAVTIALAALGARSPVPGVTLGRHAIREREPP